MELVLTFASAEALQREYDTNLQHGRAFVPDAGGLQLFAACKLRLTRADTQATLELEARVVMVSDRPPMLGIAVELGGPWREQVAGFIQEKKQEEEEADEAPESVDRGRRMQRLSVVERMKVAQGANMADRVLVERIYGGAVWDTLLRNPHITVPEVARIARKGNVPRPLLDLIVDNANWVRQDIIRRALLSNPRVSPEAMHKILRAMPARELRLLHQQTAYPAHVRALARKLAGVT